VAESENRRFIVVRLDEHRVQQGTPHARILPRDRLSAADPILLSG
jgi:hypothetical protein